eukprot:4091987-Alexandrium_andersonii.AAC.1
MGLPASRVGCARRAARDTAVTPSTGGALRASAAPAAAVAGAAAAVAPPLTRRPQLPTPAQHTGLQLRT